ncbi:MAG: alpha/beta fold hydrolase [Candidatus Hodarchaeales archaeon]|jgi:pimeloyl-ACP methyl ester carboxylesterase
MLANLPQTPQIMELSSGRRLSYAEYGSPNGKPVFYFHGNFGSRLEATFGNEEILDVLGIRLICPDRPGMGFSDFQEKRSILDWPDDVLELVKYLKLEKYALIGGSGGGPYALACAYKLPKTNIVGCGVVSGLGPPEMSKKGMNSRSKNLLFFAKYLPWTFNFLNWLTMGRKVKSENKEWWEKNYQKLQKQLPEPDRKIMENSYTRDCMTNKTIEAFRQGIKGPSHDFKLYARPWGFKLEDIPIEMRVSIFHGELDTSVPISMAKTMSSLIPNCHSKYYPEEGHLSLYINNLEEILTLILD